jgi:hypothetical protein
METRRKFDQEFKEGAVRIVRETFGRPEEFPPTPSSIELKCLSPTTFSPCLERPVAVRTRRSPSSPTPSRIGWKGTFSRLTHQRVIAEPDRASSRRRYLLLSYASKFLLVSDSFDIELRRVSRSVDRSLS